jgi:hypothetical protein
MSQSAAHIPAAGSVIVSLKPGPRGTFRLSYEIHQQEIRRPAWTQQFATRHNFATSYGPAAIEIDPEKLRKLTFSKDELAEIGFSLVKQLWRQDMEAQHTA